MFFFFSLNDSIPKGIKERRVKSAVEQQKEGIMQRTVKAVVE